jgi:hypothetical protein
VSGRRGGETLAIPPSKSAYRFLQLEITRTPSAAIARRAERVVVAAHVSDDSANEKQDEAGGGGDSNRRHADTD